MASDLVVVGAGGHGRELYATILGLGESGPQWNVIGFVDDGSDHPERIERLGSRILGTVAWLVENPSACVLGIGTSATRRHLVARLTSCAMPAIISSDAAIGPDVEIGDGVVVYERSVITTNVRIGAHTHVNVGCAIQHDTVVGDYVQMSPGVFVNGDCEIGDDVFLGTGAIVTRGCRVGAGAQVGAGAVVLTDVAPGTAVVGVPARPR